MAAYTARRPRRRRLDHDLDRGRVRVDELGLRRRLVDGRQRVLGEDEGLGRDRLLEVEDLPS